MAATLPDTSLMSVGDGMSVPRPISGARRQLPVPGMLSSRVSPPKSLLPQKVSGRNSACGGVTVQVEMERQVKVELVKHVKVECAVQESCESSRSDVARPSNLKKSNAASTRSPMPKSPRDVTPNQRSSSLTRGSIPQSKSTHVSAVQSTATVPKDESDAKKPEVSSTHSVLIQRPASKAALRQLPNTDNMKQSKPKDVVERVVAKGMSRRSPLVTDPQPSKMRKLSDVKKKSDEGEKMQESEKTDVAADLKPNSVAKSESGGRSKIAKPSLSTVTAKPTTQKRLPHLNPAAAKPVKEAGHGNDNLKRSKPDSADLPADTKSTIQTKNPMSRKSILTLRDSQNPSGDGHGLRKPGGTRRGLPGVKQSLLSAAGKDSSSQRTSTSSLSSASRSEFVGRNVLVESTRSSVVGDCGSVVSDSRQQEITDVQYHQPDVVSNLLQHELPIKRLRRLEVRCEELGKQLSISATELKTQATGFEAMLVVVKRYAEQMESLAKTISRLRCQLVSSDAKCDVLSYQRNALIAEIQGLKEDHEVQVNGMTVTHQMELHALEEKTKAVVKQIEERHLKAAAVVQSECRQVIDDLKSQHEKELEAKDATLERQASDVETKYKQKISDLQRNHDANVKELINQFELVKSALVEKIEHLNSECSELRQRNQILMEGDPAIMTSSFGNPELEKQVETLSQEIESLTVVLELRNEELGKFRNQAAAQESQLSELTDAKQRILQLERKLENTEAMLHLKSDYERELAEKHSTLLRRFSKESKVNKRLSMNNEELMWKLEQVATATSPTPIRRTLSGPPAKSAPGTPLLVRRSQPEMNWESFISESGALPDSTDSDQA